MVDNFAHKILNNASKYLKVISQILTCSVFASIVALLAFIVSLYGLHNSNKNLKLSIIQYNQERLMVLKSVIDNEKEYIRLVPISSNTNLLNATLFFPSKIFNSPETIMSNGSLPHVLPIKHYLAEYLKNLYEPELGYIARAEIYIPVIIASSYISHGEAYIDTSLYIFKIFAFIPEDDTPFRINFEDIFYRQRISLTDEMSQKEIQEYVDLIFDQDFECHLSDAGAI